MNFSTIHYLNVFLGSGAIILQILAVIALLVLFFGPKKNKFLDFTRKHFLSLGFLISLFAALFSLVYSEAVHFIPCQLCWWQRIFMFPQVFLFGIALWDQDRKVIRYVIPLLSAGFVIALYQNFIYYFGNSANAVCDSSGISCFQHLVSEFGGYISIPMLALTSFFALLVLSLITHFYKEDLL
jgi:disulfide bond formation protein DsbB